MNGAYGTPVMDDDGENKGFDCTGQLLLPNDAASRRQGGGDR